MTCILLVEDNPLNRIVIEDIFEFDDIPASLLYVETGEEALTTAVQSQPVLILLDIQLPGMNGLETAKALKANPQVQEIPIWGISAQAMEGDGDKAISAGFQRYITKPFDTHKLGQELRKALASTAAETTKRSRIVATHGHTPLL